MLIDMHYVCLALSVGKLLGQASHNGPDKESLNLQLPFSDACVTILAVRTAMILFLLWCSL